MCGLVSYYFRKIIKCLNVKKKKKKKKIDVKIYHFPVRIVEFTALLERIFHDRLKVVLFPPILNSRSLNKIKQVLQLRTGCVTM